MSNGSEPSDRQRRRWRWPRLWPRSLAARTALVLLAGLAVVQLAGLAIHAMDRIAIDRTEIERAAGIRVAGIYRSVAETDPDERNAEAARMKLPPGFHLTLTPGPDIGVVDPVPPHMQRTMRVNMQMVPLPARMRPTHVHIGGEWFKRKYVVSLHLPDEGRWVTVAFRLPRPNLFASPTFPIAFTLMIVATGLLTLWSVRRLTEPVRTLAAAAEALGRDVNAPPLPEDGPLEVATAAIAFNTMASRIRRFVTDRTLLLTAIGHDLRTPITRLKLRAEFIDDDELRRKFIADLDELEAMVSATLAFGRDSANREPMVQLDLAALMRTILDEAVEGRPEMADQVGFTEEPPPISIRARSMALKRALSNLVGNAIAYGGNARVTIRPPNDSPDGRFVAVLVEDSGSGLQRPDLERVFEPFVRLETSRNRETGGTGLGLAIARNIVRGHGGDIVLANRQPHGLRATVTLLA